MLEQSQEDKASSNASRPAGTAEELHDTQNLPDDRNVRIDKVGVRGVRQPIRFRDADGGEQETVAIIGMAVDLAKEVKGTHMSRFIEALNAHQGPIDLANLGALPAVGSYVVALPMKIQGGSGGPLRIVAFVPHDSLP